MSVHNATVLDNRLTKVPNRDEEGGGDDGVGTLASGIAKAC